MLTVRRAGHPISRLESSRHTTRARAGNYAFYTKIDATVCDESLIAATQKYLYGSYVVLGLAFGCVFIMHCLSMRKGSFKKALGLM